MVQTIRDILSRIRAGTTTAHDADILLSFLAGLEDKENLQLLQECYALPKSQNTVGLGA